MSEQTARDVIADRFFHTEFNPELEDHMFAADRNEWGERLADIALDALTAAGFVVIDPTDPEVIQRAARALHEQSGNVWPPSSDDAQLRRRTAAVAVLAALGEPGDRVPSIAQAMANDPTGSDQ